MCPNCKSKELITSPNRYDILEFENGEFQIVESEFIDFVSKDNIALPYQNPTDKRIRQRLKEGYKGRMPYSWFYFDLVKNVSKDKTFHACQIPLGLVEMLIKSCTNEGDSVFVLFGGSGGEIVLCEKLKRKWLSCELHKPYYEMILDRLANKGKIKDEFKLALKGANLLEGLL